MVVALTLLSASSGGVLALTRVLLSANSRAGSNGGGPCVLTTTTVRLSASSGGGSLSLGFLEGVLHLAGDPISKVNFSLFDLDRFYKKGRHSM